MLTCFRILPSRALDYRGTPRIEGDLEEGKERTAGNDGVSWLTKHDIGERTTRTNRTHSLDARPHTSIRNPSLLWSDMNTITKSSHISL